MNNEKFEKINSSALAKIDKVIKYFEGAIIEGKELMINISTDFYLQELILSRLENKFIDDKISAFEKEYSCALVIRFGNVLLIPRITKGSPIFDFYFA